MLLSFENATAAHRRMRSRCAVNAERARVNGASEIVSLRERFWVAIPNQTHEKQQTNP